MRRFFVAAFVVALTCGTSPAQKLPPAEREEDWKPSTNGLERERVYQGGTRWHVNGREVSEAQGRAALVADDGIPDDSRAPSLTLIGGKEDTSKLRKAWLRAPDVAEVVSKFLVQEFEPSNPLISRAGFRTDGKPTIYAEMPDGRTLFRLDEYPGDVDFIRTCQHALQVVDGVRKPHPDYQPASDPGILPKIQPKIDAEVSPAPWTLILSHFATLIVGMLAGAGGVVGGGVFVRKILGAAIAAELERARASAPPAAPVLK